MRYFYTMYLLEETGKLMPYPGAKRWEQTEIAYRGIEVFGSSITLEWTDESLR